MGGKSMIPGRPLDGFRVAVSVSESSEPLTFGVSKRHIHDAMIEISRFLLAWGAVIVYGGDLRKDGFTRLLAELVVRHTRLGMDGHENTIQVENVMAWPVHVALPNDELDEFLDEVEGYVKVALLNQAGNEIAHSQRLQMTSRVPTPEQWVSGLSNMRNQLTENTDARIVLGGATEGFKGKEPGVIEEARSSLTHQKPVYVFGGYGGAATLFAREIGFLRDGPSSVGSNSARPITWQSGNGLDWEENQAIAGTAVIDEAVALLLKGLLKVRGHGTY